MLTNDETRSKSDSEQSDIDVNLFCSEDWLFLKCSTQLNEKVGSFYLFCFSSYQMVLHVSSKKKMILHGLPKPCLSKLYWSPVTVSLTLYSTHLAARTATEKTHAVLQNHVHVSNKCGFINSCRFSTHIMGEQRRNWRTYSSLKKVRAFLGNYLFNKNNNQIK